MTSGYAIRESNIPLTNSSTEPEKRALSQIDTAKKQKRRNSLKLAALVPCCLLLVASL
jgi:hypothetical protein